MKIYKPKTKAFRLFIRWQVSPAATLCQVGRQFIYLIRLNDKGRPDALFLSSFFAYCRYNKHQ